MATIVGHVKDDVGGVYIGRPRTGQAWGFGNPFSIGEPHRVTGKPMTRKEVIEEFELWLLHGRDDRARWIMDNVHLLKNKYLKCFCAPQPCHGDVLKKLADSK